MLAQSNKLVGITRAMESRWWRRRRSPPACPRHQLAELNPAPGLSSIHIHTYIHTFVHVRTYFTRVRYIAFVAAPLADADP